MEAENGFGRGFGRMEAWPLIKVGAIGYIPFMVLEAVE